MQVEAATRRLRTRTSAGREWRDQARAGRA